MRTLLLLLGLALPSCRAQQLRRSLLFHHETTDEVDCLYILNDVKYENGEREELDTCLVNEAIYNLPIGLLDEYKGEIQSGKTRLNIVGATLQRSGGVDEANKVIMSRRRPRIRLYNKDEQHSLRTSNHQETQTVGDIKVIAVRVTSKDANVTLSKKELSRGMFGGNGEVTLESQLHQCSAGALTILTGVRGGVGELYIDVNTTGVAAKNLENLVRNEFINKFGPESDYNHILFCLPKGTTSSFNNWIAYAYRHTRFSYYNDAWCGSLTSKMHEIG